MTSFHSQMCEPKLKEERQLAKALARESETSVGEAGAGAPCALFSYLSLGGSGLFLPANLPSLSVLVEAFLGCLEFCWVWGTLVSIVVSCNRDPW